MSLKTIPSEKCSDRHRMQGGGQVQVHLPSLGKLPPVSLTEEGKGRQLGSSPGFCSSLHTLPMLQAW